MHRRRVGTIPLTSHLLLVPEPHCGYFVLFYDPAWSGYDRSPPLQQYKSISYVLCVSVMVGIGA